MTDNIKLYLVHFKNRHSSESFYKIGITSKYDVLDRFKYDMYNDWNIKVVTSAYGPRDEVELAEQKLLKMFPKNLWIEQKISGVTEIVKLSSIQLEQCMKLIKGYSQQWYAMRMQHE